jgi:hypothetical protein
MHYANEAAGSDLSGHDTTSIMDHDPQAIVDVAPSAGRYPIPQEAQLLNDQRFSEGYDSLTVAHDGVHTAPARMGNQVTPH